MDNKFKITILIGVIAVLGCSIWSASMSTANSQSNHPIKVSKTTEGDFNVTNGAIYAGSNFNTTYDMTGTASDFIKSRGVLTSSILGDFGKSPTIGYIKMNKSDTQTNTNVTGFANPYVSKEQIDEKIISVLSYALDKIEHPVGISLNTGDSRQIKCVFGNILDDFWCDIPTYASK